MALSAPRRPSLIPAPLRPRNASASSMNSSSPCDKVDTLRKSNAILCCLFPLIQAPLSARNIGVLQNALSFLSI